MQQQFLAQQAARTIEEVFATFHQNLLIVASLFERSAVTLSRALEVRASLKSTYQNLGDTPVIDELARDPVLYLRIGEGG